MTIDLHMELIGNLDDPIAVTAFISIRNALKNSFKQILIAFCKSSIG
jgi:hypothetical protein